MAAIRAIYDGRGDGGNWLVNRRRSERAVARITVWPTSGSRQKVPKTARADFNGAFLRLCQPTSSASTPKISPPSPIPDPPWTKRVNGAHSLLRSFISPSPLLLVPLLYTRWREPDHCCCIKYKKKKENHSLKFFLRSTEFLFLLLSFLFLLLLRSLKISITVCYLNCYF